MKPSPESIFAKAEALVARFAKRNALYDRLDTLYFMENKRVSPDGSVQYVTMPYATSVIDLIVDLASQMDYTISVPAAGEGLDDEKDAEALEAWLRAWLSMNGRKQQRNLIGEAAFLAAQRAQCIARTLFVDKSIKLPENEEAEATVAGLPVVFQLRDPRHVYVADGPLGPRYVVERWERPAADVRALYPSALPSNVNDDALVEWTEYWDATYRAYFVDGEPVKQKGGVVVAHGYGCIPYAFGNGRTTPFRDGERRYRPVLSGVESLAATIDTWFSINATAGLASVTNAWAVYSDQYSGDNGKDFDTSPGAVNYLSSSDKVQAIQRASMPPDFFQLGSLLFQAWQAETFPFNLFGQSPGDLAGYAISLLSQAGRRIILPIWKAVGDMLAGAMLNCVTICQKKVAPLVGNKIPLVITTQSAPTARRVKRKLRLDVTKFGDDLDLTVTLSDPMPQDVAANVRMALEATKGGLLSNETALEKFKLSSEPAAEMERIAVEAVYRTLAPIEGVKLAQERGYVPRQVTIPPGFVAAPDGMLIPQALLDSMRNAQQAAQSQGPAAPQLDQATLQQLMAQMQAGMEPAPTGTGEPTGFPNPVSMQSLSGNAIEPQLDDLAPQPPRAKMPGGF